MYDPASGIEVFIQPWHPEESLNLDSQYPEYEAPRGSPLYQLCGRTRYIEAVTDQRYQMVVMLHPQFNFGKNLSVQIRYDIDGRTLDGVQYIDRSERDEEELLSDVKGVNTSLVHGEWQDFGFAFAEIRADDSVQLSKAEGAVEVETRGKIRIEVQRGNQEDAEPIEEDYEDELPNIEPKDTTKRVAIQHGKSHGIRYVPVGKSEHPEPADWTPARGKFGQPIEITFYYTSRTFLEMKGIIPEAPINATPSAGIDQDVPHLNSRDSETALLSTKIKTEAADDTGIASISNQLSGHLEAAAGPSTPSDQNRHPSDLTVADDDVTFISARSGKRRRNHSSSEVIDLSDDGDEELPSKQIKQQPAEKIQAVQIRVTSPETSKSVVDVNGIKAEFGNEQSVHSSSNGVVTKPEVLEQDKKPRKKVKEKDMLKLQLEEVKIKKRLMELEGEDEE